MRYKAEVPKRKRIRLHDFRLLPQSNWWMKYRNGFHHMAVDAVGAKNPEGTAQDRWTTEEAFKKFLKSHANVPLKLRKSMWAEVTVIIPHKDAGCILDFTAVKKRLYTYEIEELFKKEHLIPFVIRYFDTVRKKYRTYKLR